MLSGQYIKMNGNGAPTILSLIGAGSHTYLVAVRRILWIGCYYTLNGEYYSHCSIWTMSLNLTATSFIVPSWVIYVPISCRHQLRQYWQPRLANTTARRSLLPTENECQRSVNHIWCFKFGNWIVSCSLLGITYILAAFLGKKDCNMVTATFWEWESTSVSNGSE
jgi:hypothetical protein